MGVGEPGSPGIPGESIKGEPGADGMKGEKGEMVSFPYMMISTCNIFNIYLYLSLETCYFENYDACTPNRFCLNYFACRFCTLTPFPLESDPRHNSQRFLYTVYISVFASGRWKNLVM